MLVRPRQHHDRDAPMAASTASNGGRRACSRCRSTPAISISIRAGASARGSPPPTISAMMLNLFHNEDFVFDNGYAFPERQGAAEYFSGEGEFIPVRPGRNMWETNFVPDLAAFELKHWKERGAGGSNMMFMLADGTMHAHISQMPVGTYKKAPSPRRRLPRLRRHRPRLFAALVRGREGLRAHRLAARRGVRATGPDVPPALQHGARSRALPGGRLRQPALSVHHRQAPCVHGHGRERQGRRLPDRVRAPGPAHPPASTWRLGQVPARNRGWRNSSTKRPDAKTPA